MSVSDVEDDMTTNLSYRELSGILAALRLVQSERDLWDLYKNMDHFCDCEPLRRDEIDQLCNKLNGMEE